MTYLRLTLDVRAHPRGSKVCQPAEIAVFHARQFQRTTANRVESLACDAVDAISHWNGVRAVLRFVPVRAGVDGDEDVMRLRDGGATEG